MNLTHEAHQETIALGGFVDALLEGFAVAARARHVTLDALVFAQKLRADAGPLRDLLKGLVADALRRAPAGTHVSLVVSPRGPYTEFRIADEGAGIARDGLEQRCNGGEQHLRSDGSGLTSCMLAAEATGGRLSVAETNDGTVVCLALPSNIGPAASARAVVAKATPGLARSKSGTYTRSGELATAAEWHTVLVVDDEPLIRALVSRALKNAGYRVVEADCAERALEILTLPQLTISLLLSDVGLPGASGVELVRRSRVLVPGLPTLLMSGSNEAALSHAGVIAGETNLLKKPFAVEDLVGKLEELLTPRACQPLCSG